MKKFLLFIAIAAIGFCCVKSWALLENNRKQMTIVQQQLKVLQLGVKSHIDAERQNLQIDSTLWNWQLRYWTPRDAFILGKMSKAASDKANNLKQALDVFNAIDSVVVSTKTTFVSDDDKQQAKQSQQISFKH